MLNMTSGKDRCSFLNRYRNPEPGASRHDPFLVPSTSLWRIDTCRAKTASGQMPGSLLAGETTPSSAWPGAALCSDGACALSAPPAACGTVGRVDLPGVGGRRHLGARRDRHLHPG